MTDFAAFGGVSRPDISATEAVHLAAEMFGITGTAAELGSNQDRNFVITAVSGEKYVLRVDNEVLSDEARDAQHVAMDRCEEEGILVPKRFRTKNGELTARWNGFNARLSEFINLEQMVNISYFSPQVLRSFGEFAAESVQAFETLHHPGLDRKHQWDMRAAYEETLAVLDAVKDVSLKESLKIAADEAKSALDLVADDLQTQAIHGDLTDDNVMGEKAADGRTYPKVMIDFGDLGVGWRVAEIAVTLSSMLHHTEGEPLRALETWRAFVETLENTSSPVTEAEARALWPLVVLRAILLVANGHKQLELEGDNEYVRDRIAGEQEIFDTATSLSLAEMNENVLLVAGFMGASVASEKGFKLVAKPEPVGDITEVFPDLTFDEEVQVLDTGVESEFLDAGKWLDVNAESALVQEAFNSGGNIKTATGANAGIATVTDVGATVMPYGVFRLTRTKTDSFGSAATFPIDTEVVLLGNEKATVLSPVAGTLWAVADDEVMIRTTDGEWVLELSGVLPKVAVGQEVAKGESLGTTMGGPVNGDAHQSVAFGLRRYDAAETARNIPREASGKSKLVNPERAAAWLRLSPDPHFLLGLDSHAQRDESGDEQFRREEVFAKAQERYYEQPMQIERGWKHHLIDTTGRSYVDMVNNVTGLGHGHKAIADAVDKQMRLLGTNSRFLYRSLAEYSERLLSLLPKGSDLDTVLLVNSGSEAVDLALRLAQAATGRKTIVALREAYHGWTMASDAVTTSAFDNPYALDTRPDWVHIADVPNDYRGTHRGEGAGSAYRGDLAKDLTTLTENGTPVAGFICESVLGNAGGVLLPEGYLAGAYEEVRNHGGLVIADEVQVGFGRMGSTFWGFEQSGVKPDIITIAKPMGNGFPIGGVITSKKVADALASEGQFFSSAGGNPVSCQVGLAVLDAMEEEKLQDNALFVGNHLRKGFEALAEKHDMIGVVHGEGLYLGVELVRDRETLEPATEETDAICERLRELGVIVLPTSERSNVLKIKPPLTLTVESADLVVAALDHALTTGW